MQTTGWDRRVTRRSACRTGFGAVVFCNKNDNDRGPWLRNSLAGPRGKQT
jgi:hypothetical protein